MINKLTRKKPNRLLISRNNYFDNGGQVENLNPDQGKNLLQKLNGVASTIFNSPLTPAISAGIGLAGGLANMAFGSKMNTENIAKVEGNINSLNGFQSNASDFNSLALSWTTTPAGMTFDDSYIGKDGWFSNKAKNKAADLRRLIEAGKTWVLNTLNNNALNIGITQMQNLLANYAAFGGNLMTHGADFNTGLTSISNGGTHENNPYEGVPMGVDSLGTPNLVEEGETIFNDYVFSKRLMVPKSLRRKYKLGDSISFADASKKLAKESDERPNDPISQNGLESLMSELAVAQEKIRTKNEGRKFAKGGKLGRLYAGYGDIPNFLNRGFAITPFYGPDPVYITGGRYSPPETKGSSIVNRDMIYATTPPPITSDIAGGPVLEERIPSPTTRSTAKETKQVRNTPNQVKVAIGENTNNNKNLAPTWMRYIPAYASGIMSITDALGLTNKPDFSDANAMLEAARDAGTYQPVRFNPIGDYLTYRPLDRDYYQNTANASAAATRRNILNTSGGNRSTAIAGLLAADNNALNQIGALGRAAEEYNSTQREKVATFNRGTNITNSEGFLKADMANQNALMNSRELVLNGTLQAANLRQKERQAALASRSANLSNFINSLGDIGRENFSRNMIVSDPSKYYTIDSSGNISYKKAFDDLSSAEQDYIVGHASRRASKSNKTKAQGGYLTIKRKK